MEQLTLADAIKHIDYRVGTEGQWVGLLDEECRPLCELPPLISVSAPEVRLDAASVEATFALAGNDRVLDELVAAGLGQQTSDGRLAPQVAKARFLAFVRAGERRVYTITHVTVGGDNAPTTITIYGVDLLEGLMFWPCPAIPVNWTSAKYADWSTDASGVEYATPRRLARVEFATGADGHTVQGEAVEVLRRIVQDSFDAVNTLHGWAGDPHAVVDFTSGEAGPEVLVRTGDDFVWDTISAAAKNAGVVVDVDVWWPGDAPVTVRTSRDPDAFEPRSWDKPMQVVSIRMMEEA